MNPRMNPPPRGPGMGPMSYPGMRGGPPNAGPIPPMGMAGAGGRPQWQPNTSTPMNYSSSSPGSYGVSDLKLNAIEKFIKIWISLGSTTRFWTSGPWDTHLALTTRFI